MKKNSGICIEYNKELVTQIFKNKKQFHHKQARLPIKEKIKILVQLQKTALTIRPKRGKNDKRIVWQIT